MKKCYMLMLWGAMMAVIGETSDVDPWPMFGKDQHHSSCSATASVPNNWVYSGIFGTGNNAIPDNIPAIGTNNSVFFSSRAGLTALDASTGAPHWVLAFDSTLASSPTVGYDNTVFCGSSDFNVYAVSGSSGNVLWNYTTGGIVSSTPALGQQLVYVGSRDFSLYAINRTTGQVAWTLSTHGEITGAPVLGSDGTVYFGSDDFFVYAVQGKSGLTLWTFETGNKVGSTPAISNDGQVVYVGSTDHSVYALHTSSGNLQWNFTTLGEVSSSPAIGTDGTVFVGGSDGWLYALEPDTGMPRWTYQGTVNAEFYSPSIGVDGSVYVTTSENELLVLNANTGVLYWDITPTRPRLGLGIALSLSSLAIAGDGAVYYEIGSSFVAVAAPPLGFYWVAYGTATPCGVGNYCPRGYNSPLACPVGTYGPSNLASSVYACRSCPPGAYCGFAGLSFYVSCDAGTYNPVYNATSVLACLACPIGTYNNQAGGASCTPCPAGTFNPHVGQSLLSSCLACAPGTFSTALGATSNISCVPCERGTYSARSGAVSCVACPAGYFNPSLGSASQASCLPCPFGTYSSFLGSPSESLCTECPMGSYGPQLGATLCVLCPKGTANAVTGSVTLTDCLTCQPGTFGANRGAALCSACSVGTFNPTSGNISQNACTFAAVGSYVGIAGASSATPCLPGYYSKVPGASICNACLPGSVAPDSGSSLCDLCPPGYVSSTPGSTSCSACGVGTYADGFGQSVCTPCAAGTFLDAVAGISMSNCTPCAAGKYNPIVGQGSSSCLPCPPGSASSLASASTPLACVVCPSGHFSTGGSSFCSICPPGTYAETPGAFSCLPCPRGTYSSLYGSDSAINCLTCPAGRTTFTSGAAQVGDCVDTGSFVCPPGTQASVVGSTPRQVSDCGPLSCLAGTQLSVDNTGCVGCTPGTVFSKTGNCTACPVNRTCVGIVSVSFAASPASWVKSISADAVVGDESPHFMECASVLSDLVSAASSGISLEDSNVKRDVGTSVSLFSAIAVASIILGLTIILWASRSYSSSVARILRSTDSFASQHLYGNHEYIQIRRTELGGACTMLAFGAMAALAASTIAQHILNNSLTQSSLLSLGATTLTEATVISPLYVKSLRAGWPPLAGLLLVIAAEGDGRGNCLVNASAGFTDLNFGASQLTSFTCGTTSISFISCPACVFGSNSAFSTFLPYSCQNLIVGVAVVDALGEVLLQSTLWSPIEGSLLKTVSWQISPLLQVLTNTVDGTRMRGFQALKGPSTNTMTPVGASVSIVPNAAAVKVQIGLSASQLYASVTVTSLQSVPQASICVNTDSLSDYIPVATLTCTLQLLAAILGILGLMRAFAKMFACTERKCGRHVMDRFPAYDSHHSGTMHRPLGKGIPSRLQKSRSWKNSRGIPVTSDITLYNTDNPMRFARRVTDSTNDNDISLASALNNHTDIHVPSIDNRDTTFPDTWQATPTLVRRPSRSLPGSQTS